MGGAAGRVDAPPIVITGSSGGGKSTLIANWLAAHRLAQPANIVFEHYLGASSPETCSVGRGQALRFDWLR